MRIELVIAALLSSSLRQANWNFENLTEIEQGLVQSQIVLDTVKEWVTAEAIIAEAMFTSKKDNMH